MQVRLYSTLGCHLCDDAALLLDELGSVSPLEVAVVEIADTDDLVVRYGIRIPVVQREDDAELGWPFTIEELRHFLFDGNH